MLHRIPGIDAKARRIFYAALRSDIISTITEQSKDETPALEEMLSDLEFYLAQISNIVSNPKDKRKFQELINFLEQHGDNKDVVTAAYLQYLLIPESVSALKEEGLWNEDTDEPIYPTKKYYE